MTSRWTLGFATVDQGTPPFPETIRNQFTIQSILAHQPLVEEIVVIDNGPDNQTPLREFCNKCGPRVRYVPFKTPQGTSAPRNEVFKRSRTEYTACIDGHVILGTAFFHWLDQFYARHGGKCPDLLHGMMVTESGGVHATHMNDQWRGEMWGTWGTCWENRDGSFRFSCVHPGDDKIVFVSMDDNAQRPLTEDEVRSRNLHEVKGWSGHEQCLRAAGWAQPTEPFVVPGHGMGFFACRTDSWLPFHPDARGFGGEEMTTAVRYRQALRRCWTVPQARWWHDFGRWYAHQEHGTPPPYRLSLWDKVRNYVLEFKRLGMDVNIVRAQFPPSRFPEEEWQQLLRGVSWPTGPGKAPIPDDLKSDAAAALVAPPPQTVPIPEPEQDILLFDPQPAPAPVLTVDDHFLRACSERTDVAEDLPWLRQYASRCGPLGDAGHVTEVVTSGDPMSSLAFLAAGARSLTTVGPPKGVAEGVSNWIRPGTFYHRTVLNESFRSEMLEPADLIYLDVEPYTADVVWDALTKYAEKSRRYVIVRGSVKFPERSERGEKLVVPAVRTYLTRNPHWTSVAHHPTPYGLMVLSRDDRDKGQLPSLIRKALNFGHALALHTANGFTPATEEVRNARLEACVACTQRFHDYCAHPQCGCNITKKASWSQEACPLNKWPA